MATIGHAPIERRIPTDLQATWATLETE